VVLAWSSGTPQTTIDRLRGVGLRVVSVPTFRLTDVPAALRQLGALAGTAADAEDAARRFEDAIRLLRVRYSGARVLTVFVQIDDQPLYTVGGRHIISEVVELCGGRNVFETLSQVAPAIDVEAVLARDPQVILSTDDTVADPAAAWRRWPQLEAVRAGTVYSLPADLVARATPRLAAGAQRTCEVLDDARARIASVEAAP
jgi:iron complex transport system substrate-binding protein